MSSSFFSSSNQTPQNVEDITSLKEQAETARDEAESSRDAAAASASSASSSASSASTSASNASSSASSAATSYNNFRSVYLGSSATAPTVDGNGNALQAGDLYQDSSTGSLKYYNGSTWEVVQPGDGFTGGSYNASTGVVTFTSNDGLGFSTDDLRGATGAGFTGGSYDTPTGVVTFSSNDGLSFSTDDLRGTDGSAATISIGDVTTGAAGTSAAVTNSGTSSAATFDFVIPAGETGPQGSQGQTGATGSQGPTGATGDGFTGGSYNSGTGVVTFTSDDGLGFSTGDLRGAPGTGTGDLLASYNLADVDDIASARTNLGLGSAAVEDTDAFEAALTAISATTSDTAVDLFVYDTSKDSDGGAWRYRTQHTSWYNETLNTSTRGKTKEFPVVAIIVATASSVIIYDAFDLDANGVPEMWMVFNRGTALHFYSGIATTHCISALNGEIWVGSADTNGFLKVFNFLKDRSALYGTNGFYSYNVPQISARNTTNAGDGSYTDSSKAIVDANINDVAMTVLPDASIDTATGIQIPTIALVTVNGISVIKDDGTVVSNSNTLARYGVAFGEDLTLLVVETHSSDTVEIYDYPDYLSAGFSITRAISNSPANYPSLSNIGLIPASIVKSGKNESWAVGSTGGLNLFQGYTQSGMVAYTTSDYATGWLNGDIKGAFLASTDNTSLDGTTNLVSNATFDSDLTGWSTSSADWNWDSTSERAYLNTSTNYQAITYDTDGGMEAGKSYIVTFDYELVTGSFRFAQSAVNDYTTTFPAGSGSGTATIVIGSQPTDSRADRILLQNLTASTELYIDNVSITPLDPDRSVNANPLTVNGTITKSEVATGAELMEYSGWSTTSYLEQAYNSDLDFGTGEFAIIGWIKEAANSAVETILERDSSTTAQRFTLAVNASGFLTFTCDDDTTARTATSTIAIDNDTWTHFVATYDGAGGLRIYLNGVLNDTETGAALLTLSNASAVLRIGLAVDGAEPLTNGSLALLRISATIPSDSQIARIYQDEKFLFQENAACKLYGTSDAVTALAYDSATNLLHAGTSAGRSVFQGLRRVDNTTTAVGTAISAQNNLVADE